MRLTNGDGARAALAAMSTEKLTEGLRVGAQRLAVLGDPADYQGQVNYTVGHPEAEMRETTRGRQHYARGFARLRYAMEVAMVDTYQEILRRGAVFDVSGIRMLYLPDWRIPRHDDF